MAGRGETAPATVVLEMQDSGGEKRGFAFSGYPKPFREGERYTLDGDPIAWAALVAREGFVDCAMTDHTTAAVIAHD